MKTLSFYGTCDARSTKVLCSERIKYPYMTKQIHVTFPKGCQNLMQIEIFMSLDDDTPTSGKPNGPSILAENSQVAYIVGEGTEKHLEHEVECQDMGSFLKVYANNTDYYDHDIDVQVEIEPYPGKEE